MKESEYRGKSSVAETLHDPVTTCAPLVSGARMARDTIEKNEEP